MSYKNKVISDRPIGYWQLNNITNNLSISYNDPHIYYNGSIAYNGDAEAYVIPDRIYNDNPIFVNFASQPTIENIAPLTTFDSTETYFNACRIDNSSSLVIPNVYNSLYKGYEEKTFGIEFWLLVPQNYDSNLNILTVENEDVTANIYVNNDAIYFDINGLTHTTSLSKDPVTAEITQSESTSAVLGYSSKKQLRSWDSKMHIFALYRNKTISIYVNGLVDETINLPENFEFISPKSNQLKIKIGPSGPNKNFIISDLAVYDRPLSVNEIRSHLFWASRDSDPLNFSYQTNTSHFLNNSNSGRIVSQRSFNYPGEYTAGYFDGLISNNTGLTIAKTDIPGSLIGTWTYNHPINYYTNFAAMSISWDSAVNNNEFALDKYVCVFISYNGGEGYYPVTNGKVVPYFSDTVSDIYSANILIKVQIYSADTSLAYQPRIDNLDIKLYSSLDIISDSGSFSLSPASSIPYMLRSNDNSFISRTKKLGFNFEKQTDEGIPGSLLGTTLNGSTYRCVEFWFTYNGEGAAILDTNQGGVDIYVDTSDNTLISNIAGGVLYVNSVDKTLSPITLIIGEPYHIIMVYPDDISNNFFLNKAADNSLQPCSGSYGYVTLFHDTLSHADVESRYISYLTSKVAQLNDSETSFGSVLEYAGTSSQVNSGKPVFSHTHIY
jgi:hypothetical protein